MMLPVLNYHAIGGPSSAAFSEWAIERDAFARQLDFLESRGLVGVTMSQALDAPAPNQVALTFDDGYEDFFSAAMPELDARGFRASVYVATRYVGESARWLSGEGAGNRPMMTWDQVLQAHNDGFEVGSHSHSHAQLDLLDALSLQREVDESKNTLHEVLGQAPTGFCYPHGFHGAKVRDAVVSAGFTYACGVKHKIGTIDQDRFSIARIVVRRGDTIDQLGRWLDGHNLRRGGAAIEKSLAWGFRQYRRVCS